MGTEFSGSNEPGNSVPIGSVPNWLFHLTQSGFICYDGYIIVKLKNRSRNSRCDRTLEGSLYDLCFIFSGNNQKDLLCLHDSLDTHSVSLAWYIFFFFEETLVGFNGAFCQIDAVCLFFKCRTRFVESDMSVMAQSKKLKINAACLAGMERVSKSLSKK